MNPVGNEMRHKGCSRHAERRRSKPTSLRVTDVKSVTCVSEANVSETHTCCPVSREDAVRIRNPEMTADALKR